jgi:hypothetical protein
MRFANPGGFLTCLAVLAVAGVGGALYMHWWPLAALLSPILLCHIGLFFQVRAAAYILIAAYVIGCIFFVVSLFTPASSHATPIWKPALKVCFNILVIHELVLWLRRQA